MSVAHRRSTRAAPATRETVTEKHGARPRQIRTNPCGLPLGKPDALLRRDAKDVSPGSRTLTQTQAEDGVRHGTAVNSQRFRRNVGVEEQRCLPSLACLTST